MRGLATLMVTVVLAVPAAAQLADGWMVPAAAHNPGVGGTFWVTDLTLHNPHRSTLPVVIWVLPSDTDNGSAVGWSLDLGPYETVNLWDALGPETFGVEGTAAVLVVADPDLVTCTTTTECAFLVSSRTYTPSPDGGEYGQGIPGRSPDQGVDWMTFGYVAGVLEGNGFRTNVGAASWSAGWVTLRVDVQDAAGIVVHRMDLELPPFGHVQRRLPVTVEGGSLVFYLVDGPSDALVFPYASVVNETTGDPTYLAGEPSAVGVSVETTGSATSVGAGRRALPAGPRRTLPSYPAAP